MDVAEARKCDIIRRARNGATPGDLTGFDAIAFSACFKGDLIDISGDGATIRVTEAGKSYYSNAVKRNVGRMQVVGDRVDTNE